MTKKGFVASLSGMMVFGLASTALAADGVAQAAGLWSFFGIAIACGVRNRPCGYGNRDRHGQCDQRRSSGHGKKPGSGRQDHDHHDHRLGSHRVPLYLCPGHLFHYGLQDPGPWADVQRYPEKLWRLIMEYLLGGFPPAQPCSVKKSLRSIATRRSQWLSHAAMPCMISHPDRAAL